MADEDVRRLRLRAQRLEPRCEGGAAALAHAVCGLQAQDPTAALLSVRARTTGLTAAAVQDDGGLARTWAWRGTLHLLATADLPWVLSLVAPAANRGVRARWRRLGLDEAIYERARDAIAEALAAAGGPLTRAQLRERLAGAGVDAQGQRLPHLVRRAALDGLLVHDLDGTFAALELPPAPPRETALAELGRRYRAAYGPAERADLAAWSGLPAADVAEAWAHAEPEPDAEAAPGTVVRLLPAFDTFLLGYQGRDAVVAPEYARRVWPGGGWIHPVLLVDGRAAGTWRTTRSGDALTVTVSPFAALPAPVHDPLEAEAGDVGRFLGLPARLELA